VARFGRLTVTGAEHAVRVSPDTGHAAAAVSTGDISKTLAAAETWSRRFSRERGLPVSPSTYTRQSPGGCCATNSTR